MVWAMCVVRCIGGGGGGALGTWWLGWAVGSRQARRIGRPKGSNFRVGLGTIDGRAQLGAAIDNDNSIDGHRSTHCQRGGKSNMHHLSPRMGGGGCYIPTHPQPPTGTCPVRSVGFPPRLATPPPSGVPVCLSGRAAAERGRVSAAQSPAVYSLRGLPLSPRASRRRRLRVLSS